MRRASLLLVLVVAAFAGQYDLLICHCDPGMTSGVEDNIADNDWYDSVTMMDCHNYTPTLAEIEEYGVVFTWSNYPYDNPTAFGNNLADYMDQGGCVVSCFMAHYSSDGWGIGGRYASDANYCPLTRGGNNYSYTSLGSYDEFWGIFDDVESISDIYYWQSVSTESGAYWVADLANGTDMVAINYDLNAMAVNMYPGDYHHWTGDGWVFYNNAILFFMLSGPMDFDPPYVDGMDPDDGETDVPVDSTIVFHCKDDFRGVEVDTIDFTARDTTLSGGRAVGSGASVCVSLDSTRSIAGHLGVDDADLRDVVCTFTPDEDLRGDDTITCTVAAGLADRSGNEMGEDFVWTFSTGDYAVWETSWGAIKAEF